MEHATGGFIEITTLIVAVLSLATPVYCVPTALVALFRRSPYSPWPLLSATLVWFVQWPAIFLLTLVLPGGGSISGDGHQSILFELGMLGGFLIYNAGLLVWVYGHRRRFLPED